MKKILYSSLCMAIALALEHWKRTINGGGPLVMVRASAGNVSIRK